MLFEPKQTTVYQRSSVIQANCFRFIETPDLNPLYYLSGYMCINNYSNNERFDKVLTTVNSAFFASQSSQNVGTLPAAYNVFFLPHNKKKELGKKNVLCECLCRSKMILVHYFKTLVMLALWHVMKLSNPCHLNNHLVVRSADPVYVLYDSLCLFV